MPDIAVLRDSMWQFWGVVVGIVAIIVTVILTLVVYRLQQKRKELTYKILSVAPLVNVAKPYAGRVKVIWDDKAIADVSLVVLRLVNTGNKEILARDFEEPIEVTFPEATDVLSAEVIESTPASLKPRITTAGGAVEIAECLLNSKDAMTLAFFVVGYKSKVKFKNRIAGVGDIKPQGPAMSYMLTRLTYVLSFSVMVLVIALWLNATIPSSDFFAMLEPVLALFSIVISVVLVIVTRVQRRAFRSTTSRDDNDE